MQDRINNATIADAREYWNTQDKFVFCLDYLDLVIGFDGADYCDHWVIILEDKFDELVGA